MKYNEKHYVYSKIIIEQIAAKSILEQNCGMEKHNTNLCCNMMNKYFVTHNEHT